MSSRCCKHWNSDESTVDVLGLQLLFAIWIIFLAAVWSHSTAFGLRVLIFLFTSLCFMFSTQRSVRCFCLWCNGSCCMSSSLGRSSGFMYDGLQMTVVWLRCLLSLVDRAVYMGNPNHQGGYLPFYNDRINPWRYIKHAFYTVLKIGFQFEFLSIHRKSSSNMYSKIWNTLILALIVSAFSDKIRITSSLAKKFITVTYSRPVPDTDLGREKCCSFPYFFPTFGWNINLQHVIYMLKVEQKSSHIRELRKTQASCSQSWPGRYTISPRTFTRSGVALMVVCSYARAIIVQGLGILVHWISWLDVLHTHYVSSIFVSAVISVQCSGHVFWLRLYLMAQRIHICFQWDVQIFWMFSPRSDGSMETRCLRGQHFWQPSMILCWKEPYETAGFVWQCFGWAIAHLLWDVFSTMKGKKESSLK